MSDVSIKELFPTDRVDFSFEKVGTNVFITLIPDECCVELLPTDKVSFQILPKTYKLEV